MRGKVVKLMICKVAKLLSRKVEIFCFLKRFFTMQRFVQNDRVIPYGKGSGAERMNREETEEFFEIGRSIPVNNK